jgi:hypothetical protein
MLFDLSLEGCSATTESIAQATEFHRPIRNGLVALRGLAGEARAATFLVPIPSLVGGSKGGLVVDKLRDDDAVPTREGERQAGAERATTQLRANTAAPGGGRTRGVRGGQRPGRRAVDAVQESEELGVAEHRINRPVLSCAVHPTSATPRSRREGDGCLGNETPAAAVLGGGGRGRAKERHIHPVVVVRITLAPHTQLADGDEAGRPRVPRDKHILGHVLSVLEEDDRADHEAVNPRETRGIDLQGLAKRGEGGVHPKLVDVLIGKATNCMSHGMRSASSSRTRRIVAPSRKKGWCSMAISRSSGERNLAYMSPRDEGTIVT